MKADSIRLACERARSARPEGLDVAPIVNSNLLVGPNLALRAVLRTKTGSF
jgi:hypothetical protein